MRPAPRKQWSWFFLSDGDDPMPGKHRATYIRLPAADYLPTERQVRRLFGINEKSGALRGEARLRKLLHLRSKSDLFGMAQQRALTCCYRCSIFHPGTSRQPQSAGFRDFQHLHLPEFFGEGELERRNTTYRRLAEKATVVTLSSQAANDDFAAFAPNQARKARVVSFPSLLAFRSLEPDPGGYSH